jgi:hypothetical protein
LALNNTPSFAAAALLLYNDILKEKPNLIKVGDAKMQVSPFELRLPCNYCHLGRIYDETE